MTSDGPRILHVLEAVRGGTSRHVADVIRSSAGIDHHVVLPVNDRAARTSGAVADEASVANMVDHGATLHRLDMRRSAVHPANPIAATRLVALVRRVHPGVVHGHSSVGGALARLAGPPARRPVVYTPNGLATGAAAIHLERLLGHATAALVAVSDSEAALARHLRLVEPGRIRVIPNGIELHPPVPTDVADLRIRLGLAPGVPLIGTVARLVDQKAPEDFVAVCAEVIRRRPDVHGVLIGMGPLQDNMDRAIAREGLAGRFHQIEYLPRAEAVLDQLDVFALVSRFEGGPYAPLEAMRAGVPVVLSDVIGNRDVIEPGRSGMLCPFGDIDGMARAIVELLEHDSRRVAMTEAASARLRQRFDLRCMGEALTALYRALSGAGAGAGPTSNRVRRRPAAE
ncbi:MAG: glycosyltransferase [Actinomycetota bacterium]|nr:glycosyltransferase [Actinomycetota bacterium]